MHKIKDLKAGEFIDLDNYYRAIEEMKGREIVPEDNEIVTKFFVLLGEKTPDTEQKAVDVFLEYMKQVVELKNDYEFIYNPPPLPSSTEEKQPTIGDEYRQEFAQTYGVYVEIVYLLSAFFKKFPAEVLDINVVDFMFWGNYLLHKKFVENIK